ncbi:hypothetical protein B0H14DRAFT_2613301 [Mycena olivaceomarginata]|nr:hypothetical protein B0H14DRAFT_2613301 [Mycena olivaceomarginata]
MRHYLAWSFAKLLPYRLEFRREMKGNRENMESLKEIRGDSPRGGNRLRVLLRQQNPSALSSDPVTSGCQGEESPGLCPDGGRRQVRGSASKTREHSGRRDGRECATQSGGGADELAQSRGWLEGVRRQVETVEGQRKKIKELVKICISKKEIKWTRLAGALAHDEAPVRPCASLRQPHPGDKKRFGGLALSPDGSASVFLCVAGNLSSPRSHATNRVRASESRHVVLARKAKTAQACMFVGLEAYPK